MTAAIQMSGFSKDGFYDSVGAELKRTIVDTERLLFIASRPDEFPKNDEYTKRIFGFFHDIGLRFGSYRVLDKRMPEPEQARAIAEADCLFLMGGNTRAQLKYLKDAGHIPAILTHPGVVIGLSAGAINMSKRSVIANPIYPSVIVFEGMGLVGSTVIPHFDSITDEAMKNEILQLSYEDTIYGLRDDGIIVTRNGTVRFGGTVYELKHGEMKQISAR